MPQIVEAGPLRRRGSHDGGPPEMSELGAPDRLPALIDEHEIVGRERRKVGREGVDDDLRQRNAPDARLRLGWREERLTAGR